MKILLVDDDYLLAKATAKLIERLGGYSVVINDEPTAIFQACQSGIVDLVLMDVNLPGAYWQDEEISGADLARFLKTDPLTAHIPILLLTAYAMLGEQQILLQASQADGLFTKPVTDYNALFGLMTRLVSESGQIQKG
ncbi:response regulator [Allocoleopsis franciscana]|uniref:CheY-like receiver domain-containing protein n=1 Tax=Allocoleopsis franciscana PCC 7113 TaxID=1173027 RepID=K9WEU7_9CYAN|nr:response regulator [Allocoleopsis franciscana]AFZ18042.1 CheY-like receiver domain-containing protein [Allocoleopsis franciscana PCC 7113]